MWILSTCCIATAVFYLETSWLMLHPDSLKRVVQPNVRTNWEDHLFISRQSEPNCIKMCRECFSIMKKIAQRKPLTVVEICLCLFLVTISLLDTCQIFLHNARQISGFFLAEKHLNLLEWKVTKSECDSKLPIPSLKMLLNWTLVSCNVNYCLLLLKSY